MMSDVCGGCGSGGEGEGESFAQWKGREKAQEKKQVNG